MKPRFFANHSDFRKWLEENHETEDELIVGFYKVGSGKMNMTWSQSVDEALCFGWIDGVRKSIDSTSYQIRFTKRRPNSNWSAVNIRKIVELTKKGLMRPAGILSFTNRKEANSKIYAYENAEGLFPPELEELFKANKMAWEYFQILGPSYRKVSIRWVMSAKQEATRIKRLKELISESEALTNKWKDNKYNSNTKT